MGLTKKKVVGAIKFLAPYFESVGIEDFIVTGGASLLLRGIDVETDDVDILAVCTFQMLGELENRLRKQKCIHGPFGLFPFLGFFCNEIKINITTPEALEITDTYNFDIVACDSLEIKVRKLESLRLDIKKYIEKLSIARISVPELRKIRSEANRIKQLIKKGFISK